MWALTTTLNPIKGAELKPDGYRIIVKKKKAENVLMWKLCKNINNTTEMLQIGQKKPLKQIIYIKGLQQETEELQGLKWH